MVRLDFPVISEHRYENVSIPKTESAKSETFGTRRFGELSSEYHSSKEDIAEPEKNTTN